MTARLTLKAVNPHVVAVHSASGLHVGNLKFIAPVWKFKAVGYTDSGAVEPGGGPLTHRHNEIFETPDEAAINHRLGPID
jgi:hypothetical protein